jgi:hypothetical protein
VDLYSWKKKQGVLRRGLYLHIRDTEGTLIEDTAWRYTQGKEASYPQWTVKKERKLSSYIRKFRRDLVQSHIYEEGLPNILRKSANI